MTRYDLPYFCFGMALSVPVYAVLVELSVVLDFLADALTHL